MISTVPDPFPYAVLDDYWSPGLLTDVLAEFPSLDDERWKRFAGDHELKLEGSDPSLWGHSTRVLLSILQAPTWCRSLAQAFGIRDLTADTLGGGYHLIESGGLLDVHVDFNRHPNSGLYRRLNCLVYLNPDWRPGWGGELVLGGTPRLELAPLMNRTVVFATSDRSWHGHPTPWAGDTPRRSVAVYYYSPDPPPDMSADHSTVWEGRK